MSQQSICRNRSPLKKKMLVCFCINKNKRKNLVKVNNLWATILAERSVYEQGELSALESFTAGLREREKRARALSDYLISNITRRGLDIRSNAQVSRLCIVLYVCVCCIYAYNERKRDSGNRIPLAREEITRTVRESIV